MLGNTGKNFDKQNPPSGFYVYLYLRLDNTPYYVGKGKDKRAWSKNHTINLPTEQTRIVFVAINLMEHEAHLLEKKLISEYGRKDNSTGILRNLTDGGEGSTGWIPSAETIENIKRSRVGQFKGMTYEEIYGYDTSVKLKRDRSIQMSNMRQHQLENDVPNYWKNREKPQYIIDAIVKARKESVGKFFWITNGEISKKHRIGEKLPKGYKPGRTYSRKTKN